MRDTHVTYKEHGVRRHLITVGQFNLEVRRIRRVGDTLSRVSVNLFTSNIVILYYIAI